MASIPNESLARVYASSINNTPPKASLNFSSVFFGVSPGTSDTKLDLSVYTS